MGDDSRANLDYSTYQSISRLDRAAGGLNIALGAVLFVDTIVIAVMAFCCLLMSFSLFFMAAIPAFLVTGFLGIVVFVTAVLNFITGVCSVATSQKRIRLHKAFSIVTVVLDIAVIPANVFALAYGVLVLYSEINFLSILIFIIAALAILLALVSFILSTVRIVKQKNSK